MRFILAVLLVCALVGSCQEREDPETAGLPNDWPVPQLTLASGWELSRSVVALHRLDPKAYPERQWLVVFRADGTLASNAAHIEEKLAPHEFLRMKMSDTPSGFTSKDLRTYFSPDFYVEVQLGRAEAVKAAGSLRSGEYALLVTEHDSPPQILQVVLDMRKTNMEMADKIRDTMLEPLE